MRTNGPDTVVLIHGLWMTPLSWEGWVSRYRQKGFEVLTPTWPGMEVGIEALRADPSPVANIGVTGIVEHHEAIIRKLDRPPIIMGHSFGALVTQILLDRGNGAAGVAIATAPVKGIWLLPFSTLKVVFPALSNPANNHRAVPLTREQFHYAFMNEMSEGESNRVYDRHAIPGPDHVLFQAALANFNPHAATMVDFHNDTRAPLLLINGDRDHISPPAIGKSTLNLHRKSKALTEYREFAGRTHWIAGQDGWEEVADYAMDWAAKHARTAEPATTGE